MARYLQQTSLNHVAFDALIQQKVDAQHIAYKQRVAADIPLIGGLLAPIAGYFHARDQRSKTAHGTRGETQVRTRLLHTLPDTWSVFHDAVIEAEPGQFAQIDLLAIGPAGMFLIETKAWRGSFTANRDQWRRREGRRWQTCQSPTMQATRHAVLLRGWLEQWWDAGLPQPTTSWLHPLVVFTHAQWLGISNCRVPVLEGVKALLKHLLLQPQHLLTPQHIEALTDLIVRTPAPPAAPPVPLCPRCNVALVVRQRKNNTYQSQPFYGCPNFPRCRTVHQMN